MKPKILTTMPGYTAGDFRADTLAGVSVAMVALPLSLAIAIASGATPDKGLVTAIVAGFLISLLGGSRVQIGGPTGAFIVVVAGVIDAHGYAGLVTATFMAGLILLAAGFARIGGYPVGVICGNPAHLGGALDAKSCDKQVRFMSFCDTFHLPIVTLIDNGGFMLGPDAERSGINRSALRAMMAVQYIDVPIVAVYMRKAYGLGVISQYNDKLGLRLAWPTAESGAMPAEGEVDALFAREIAEADDPAAYRRMAIDRLHALKSPWKKAETFELSDVIHPAETREYIGRFIAASWHRIPGRLGPPRRWPIV